MQKSLLLVSLLLVFSHSALAECPMGTTEKDGLFSTTRRNLSDISKAVASGAEDTCFGSGAMRSFGERYSDLYCDHYNYCSKMVEDNIARKFGGEFEADNVNAASPSFILHKLEGIDDKIINAQKKNLQEMADLLSIVPISKNLKLRCPKIDSFFKIPKDEKESEVESFILPKSELNKMLSKGKEKKEACFVKNKVVKNCLGFSKIKNQNQLVTLATEKIVSLCQTTSTYREMFQSTNTVGAKLKLKEVSNINYDMGEGYTKYLEATKRIKMFSTDEEDKFKKSYFIFLEGVRCQSGIKYSEAIQNNPGHESKHGGKLPINFSDRVADVFLMNNADAKAENDRILDKESRAYAPKSEGADSDSIYSASNFKSHSEQSANNPNGNENSKVAATEGEQQQQQPQQNTYQAPIINPSAYNGYDSKNEAITSINHSPTVSGVAAKSQAQSEASRLPASVDTASEDKISELSTKLAESEKKVKDLEKQKADKEKADLQAKIDDMRKEISDLKSQQQIAKQAQQIEQSPKAEVAAPIAQVASVVETSRAPAVENSRTQAEIDAAIAAAKINNYSHAISESVSTSSPKSYSGESTRSSLVLTKMDEAAILKRIEEKGVEPFLIEEEGMIKQVVPLFEGGKPVLDENGKPSYKKIVKGKANKAEDKAKGKDRAPASISDGADLRRIEEEKIRHERERAEYLKLKKATAEAISGSGQ